MWQISPYHPRRHRRTADGDAMGRAKALSNICLSNTSVYSREGIARRAYHPRHGQSGGEVMPKGIYHREPPAPNGLTYTQTSYLLGLTINCVYAAEKRAIRRLWRDKKLRRQFNAKGLRAS